MALAAIAMTVALVAPTGLSASSARLLVGALRTLPAPKSVSPALRLALGAMAPEVGIDERLARVRVRRLLSNVDGRQVFAFAGTSGRVCVLVWPGGGSCGVVAAVRDTVWVLSSGARMRQAVVGVVSDRVRAVDVSIRGKVVRVTVKHNAFATSFQLNRGERLPRPSVLPITR